MAEISPVGQDLYMIGVMLLAAAISGDPQIQRRIDTAPKQVKAFIERRAGCNYFASEYPYDAERARDLETHAKALRCSALERDEGILRKLHAKRPDILALLTITQDVIY